jgi:hypothetical protein
MLTQTQRVSSLYDMSKPGTYAIQVSGPIPASMGTGTMKSNTVTITITQ